MNIIFYNTPAWEGAYIKAAFEKKGVDANLSFTEEKVSPEHLPQTNDADIISVFVNSRVDAKVLEALPRLKLIAARSTGFDHIDMETCRARNIAVTTVPSYGENTVAEQAFALLLAISRKICLAYAQVREEGDFSFDNLQGFDLKGKTIGVVGTGRIGRHSIAIAKGFGMKVIASDAYPDPRLAKEFGFEYRTFEELLKESDVITLHVPYLKETHHLVDEAAFQKMKEGVVLINTSRGAVVDTQALVQALRSGKVGGAGLDVLEEESVIKEEMDFLVHGSPQGHDLKTIIANHVLIDMPNVVITPHNAFNTKEALMRILDTTLENIFGFLDGKPQNIVKQ